MINRQIRREWWYEGVVHTRYVTSDCCAPFTGGGVWSVDSTSDLQLLGWNFQFYRSQEQRPFFLQSSSHVHAVPDISYRGQARADPDENQHFTCSLAMTTRWLEVRQGFGSCCLGSELSFLMRWLLWQSPNLGRSVRSTFWESEQCISRTSSILYNQENQVLAWCRSTHF